MELLRSWVAIEPQEEETDTEDTEPKEHEKGSSILWGYGRMAVLPHGNFPFLETMAKSYLLSEPPQHSAFFDMLDQHLDVRESSRVWESLLRYLRYSVVAEPHRGQMIVDRLFERYPNVSGTREGVIFIAQTHLILGELRFRRLLSSVRRTFKVVGDQVYGELLGLHHLCVPTARWAATAVTNALARL